MFSDYSAFELMAQITDIALVVTIQFFPWCQEQMNMNWGKFYRPITVEGL